MVTNTLLIFQNVILTLNCRYFTDAKEYRIVVPRRKESRRRVELDVKESIESSSKSHQQNRAEQQP